MLFSSCSFSDFFLMFLTPRFLHAVLVSELYEIVLQKEHKKLCVTQVESFAFKLSEGVCNTPYPAIPKRKRFL